MLTCKSCNNEVEPVKKYSKTWFIFWILFFIPAAIVQYLMAERIKCPMCFKNVYGGKK